MTTISTNQVERSGYSCAPLETLVELCRDKQHQVCRKDGCCHIAESGDPNASFQKCRKIILTLKEANNG